MRPVSTGGISYATDQIVYGCGSVTASATAWVNWNQYGTWTTASALYAWVEWNGIYTSASSSNQTIIAGQLLVNQITPEQLAAQQREFEARLARGILAEKEATARRVQAVGRARALLDSLLSAPQRKTLQEQKFFDLEVQARDGAKKVYRIRQGRSGNVDLLGADGKPIRRYCAHPDLFVPDEDTMLAQKLMLETAEEQFLRTANCREIAS